MVKIKCFVCGEAITIPKYIDVNKYDGAIRCKKCNSLFYIKLVKGLLQKSRLSTDNPSQVNSWADLAKKAQEDSTTQGNIESSKKDNCR
ncbi:MAG: hypothetical protein ABIB93_00295 [Chloroflexota bacterium]